MRLTTFTDYSLRVLLYVGAQPEHRATVAEVANGFGISENHVVKVVHFLGREGWLVNVRGRGGGMRLAVPAEKVNIGKVVRAAEGEDVLAECFEKGHSCRIARGCRLAGVLGEAGDAFHAVLARYTLADLLRETPSIVKLVASPRAA
jgi:Rrf2 family nitric oxide-sensitive transcriptional repressor